MVSNYHRYWKNTSGRQKLSNLQINYNLGMKKQLIVFSGLVLLVYACTPKTNPTTQTTSAPATPAVAAKPASSVQSSTAPAALAEGPKMADNETMIKSGKIVFDKSCARCHEAKSPSSYTADQWKEILREMIPKAGLSAEEGNQVARYVIANAKK